MKISFDSPYVTESTGSKMSGNGLVAHIPVLIQKGKLRKAEILTQNYIRNRCSAPNEVVVRVAHNIFVDFCDQLEFHGVLCECAREKCYLEYV